MMLKIPNVLNHEQVLHCRQQLESADWVDGRATAGHTSIKVKDNQQLPLDSALAQELGQLILRQLNHHPTFIAGVLPLKVLPPRFNRYTGGGTYGKHIDNAIIGIPKTGEQLRGDVSSTLFLSDPDAYEGGELVVQDHFGTHTVKLDAGDMVVYPASSLHHVTPVTRGVRLASFFWSQSLIREDHKRAMLWELDQGIQRLDPNITDPETLAALTGVYHNLIREWADT